MRRCLILLCMSLAASGAAGSLIQVGPGRSYGVPSAAFAVAQDGDTIEIDAGVYPGDVAQISRNNLIIRGVGGRAHLKAAGVAKSGKGTWVISGSNTTVQNIEFSEASVPDQNGAGIRQEGDGLIVSNCYFHDNEDGILGGGSTNSEVLIEYSEFATNGFGDGYSHNMYIANIRKFTLRHCNTHHAKIGHNIKTRAKENHILYNRVMDESDGTASFEIDVPNGGLTYIIGNMVQQGPQTDNSTIIAYAEEGGSNPTQHLYVINNTIMNDRTSGTFINVASNAGQTALVMNNIFVGSGTLLQGPGVMSNNLQLGDSAFVDRAGYDYHLVAGAAAVDAAIDPGSGDGHPLAAVYQYVAPCGRDPRPAAGPPDVGAFELADRDNDGMSDEWEIRHFGGTNSPTGSPTGDPDGDTMNNLNESRVGTDPTNALSVLAFSGATLDPAPAFATIRWRSESNKTYSLLSCTDLIQGSWNRSASNLSATPPVNTYTAESQPAIRFFRVTTK